MLWESGSVTFLVRGWKVGVENNPMMKRKRRSAAENVTTLRQFGAVLISLLLTSFISSPSIAQTFRLKVSKKVNGFHLPRSYMGKILKISWPENEHVVFSVEDMIEFLGEKNDILIGEVSGLRNYIAFIDGTGKEARRMILYDPNWSPIMQYRYPLAHEVGHHICKHTLEGTQKTAWEQELEADQTAGALLSRSHDMRQGIGGMTIEFAEMVKDLKTSEFARSEGSSSHPPGPLRVAAYIDGWNNGSPCLSKRYQPINPAR